MISKLDALQGRYVVKVCNPVEGADAGTAVVVRNGLSVIDGPLITVSNVAYVATATVPTSDGAFDLCSVRVYPGKKQFAGLHQLVEVAATLFNNPTVIAGDFNAARKFGKRYAKFLRGHARERLPRRLLPPARSGGLELLGQAGQGAVPGRPLPARRG